MRQVRALGIAVTAVVADAEFGDCTAARRLLHTVEMPYALGVSRDPRARPVHHRWAIV